MGLLLLRLREASEASRARALRLPMSPKEEKGYAMKNPLDDLIIPRDRAPAPFVMPESWADKRRAVGRGVIRTWRCAGCGNRNMSVDFPTAWMQCGSTSRGEIACWCSVCIKRNRCRD